MLRMDALVLVVVASRKAWLHRLRRAGFLDQLLRDFVETDQRARRIVWPCIDVEHVLHRRDKGRVRFRRNHPILRQVRFQIVFFSAPL